MNIHGRRVVLRAIEETDLIKLHAWSNDPSLWRLLGGWHFPHSLASTTSWFEALRQDQTNQRWAIDVPGHGLVGLANLLEIDWKNRHAFHGMMIGDENVRGKGVGRDTIMATMRYAFEELSFSRLDGSMIEFNEASLATYCGKCGWKEEGRQRDWYYREGRYWDRILVGVTRDDYFELAARTSYWSD